PGRPDGDDLAGAVDLVQVVAGLGVGGVFVDVPAGRNVEPLHVHRDEVGRIRHGAGADPGGRVRLLDGANPHVVEDGRLLGVAHVPEATHVEPQLGGGRRDLAAAGAGPVRPVAREVGGEVVALALNLHPQGRLVAGGRVVRGQKRGRRAAVEVGAV